MDHQRPSIHLTTRRIEPSDANSPASPSPLRENIEGRSFETLTTLPSPSNEEGYLRSSILGDSGAQSISTSFRKLNRLYSNPPSTTTSPLAIYGDSEMSQLEAPDPNTLNLEPDTRVVIPYEPPENRPEPREAASIGRIKNNEEELLAEPSSFSGEGKDARRWLLAMKAFFWVNKEIFIDQRKVVTAFLNKLNKGRAVHFAERWYTKLLDPEEEISAEECLEAFEKAFAPRDIQDRAQQDLNSLTMKQFNGDFDQSSVAFKLAQGQSRLDDDRLLVDALQRGVNYQLAVMMTGVPLTDKQRDNGWKWEQWLDQAGRFYRNVVQLHNLQGRREELGFILLAPTKPASPPEDPDAMDVDLLKATLQHKDNALLCSVRHEEGHWTKQQDTPRRKKGNHALPRNL